MSALCLDVSSFSGLFVQYLLFQLGSVSLFWGVWEKIKYRHRSPVHGTIGTVMSHRLFGHTIYICYSCR